MEYNPMEELGLVEDKQFVCNCYGFLSKRDNARRLCSKYIRNGERFFDVVSRYDDLVAYALNRENSRVGSTLKMIIPFLKANGLTDNMIYEFCKEDLQLVPGADKALRYTFNLLPTFVTSSSYEHHMMAVCDAIGFPMSNVSCTQVAFDEIPLSRQEAKAIREMSTKISNLQIPKTLYTLTNAKSLDDEDANIVTALDEIFVDSLPKMEIDKMTKPITAIGANEKAYALLEIRRKTEIEFNSTVYVGGDITDFQAMDLVRDSSGLSISYNGSEYAVRGANVAIMSNNAIVVAVLTSEFYNEGIEAVYELIDNWDRDKLKKTPCADRNLMDAMLKTFPKKLPVVKKVDWRNANDIVKESENFRKKIVK
ncbi:MAG: hypothetical protein WC248_00495 [Candidatus Methanomethylophilaceae archaeon]|jgi:predicted HAD superfamily phosphohydrolase